MRYYDTTYTVFEYHKMKRADIIAEVEKHLRKLGFREDAWRWEPQRASLSLAVGGKIMQTAIKSGCTKRVLHFELGRISGWAEMAQPGASDGPFGRIASGGVLTSMARQIETHPRNGGGPHTCEPYPGGGSGIPTCRHCGAQMGGGFGAQFEGAQA